MTVRALRVALLAVLVVIAAMLAFRTGMFSPSRGRVLPSKADERSESPAEETPSASAAQPTPTAEVVSETSPDGDAAVFTAHVDAVSPRAVPGGTLDAAVVLDIASGWHVNANPASDEFLIPTEVALGQGAPAEIERVSYPKSTLKTLSFSETPLAVYEGHVLIPLTLRIPETAAGESLLVPLGLTCQACDDTRCLAPQTLDLMLRVLLGTSAR